MSLAIQLLEWAAMALTALSVWLAARQNRITWPVGIVGCVLYAVLFHQTQLYADATLQLFFIATGVIGWRQWKAQPPGCLPGRRPAMTMPSRLGLLAVGGAVTLAYGSLLHHFTNAFAPFWDSAVLAFSVIAQVLLMQGRRETWPCWLVVNTLSVPLYLSRGLDVTAALYAVFWFNAWYGWWRWSRAAAASP
jgi:nicotinamide mononucleotide transporter